MLIFDELWNVAFSPCEHRYERNSDYDTVSRRINAQMDVLRQNASKTALIGSKLSFASSFT